MRKEPSLDLPDDAFTQEELSDMPDYPPPHVSELDEMALRGMAIKAIKDKLPMLYTARGNVIKVKGLGRVNASYARQLIRRSDAISSLTDKTLVIQADDYILTIRPELADKLREYGLIEELLFAGWRII